MPDIHRVETVDILCRIERRHHLPRVDTERQRQLDEDAVDPVVTIEPGDQLKDCRYAAIAWQPVLERGDPHFGAGASLVANIELARRIVADQDRGKTGGDPIPIVVVSVNPVLPRSFDRLGVRRVVSKPFDVDVLVDAVQEAIQTSAA